LLAYLGAGAERSVESLSVVRECVPELLEVAYIDGIAMSVKNEDDIGDGYGLALTRFCMTC
jgi:hypothetical protein